MNKAFMILDLAKSGQLQVGDHPRCPTCNTPNYCSQHRYTYVKWLERSMPYLQILASIR